MHIWEYHEMCDEREIAKRVDINTLCTKTKYLHYQCRHLIRHEVYIEMNYMNYQSDIQTFKSILLF